MRIDFIDSSTSLPRRGKSYFLQYRRSHVNNIFHSEDGEIIVSKIFPRGTGIHSLGYKNCFGVGIIQRETGNKVLALICSGNLVGNGFSSVFLRRDKHALMGIFSRMSEMFDPEKTDIGIMASTIFPSYGREGIVSYLTGIRILNDILEDSLGIIPSVWSAPSLGGAPSNVFLDDFACTVQKKVQIGYTLGTKKTLPIQEVCQQVSKMVS